MTSSLFRLPDWLGGHPCTPITRAGGKVLVLAEVPGFPGGKPVEFDAEDLVEVEPPLPPEPHADGSFVTVDSPGNKVWAFSRHQAVHRSMFPKASMLDDYWWWHDNGDWVTWKQICGMGAPKVLVPDPHQDAPELPWEITDRTGTLFKITESADGAVLCMPGAVRFNAPELERIAVALWGTARKVRSGATS